MLESTFLGPVISLAGSRTMGIDWSWKPMKPEDIATLTRMIDAVTLASVIDRVYPLAEVPDALRYLEQGRALGKIVITV